jgi:predicted DNA-binding transcriptional regulator YafY
MVDSAITRTARAMDIIPFVLENPGIKISDLALKFNVSEKQIIKDLELIFLCGLPGYTPYELIDLTFEDGAVTIIDPQLFDKPRRFSETEAVIISLGLTILKNSITVEDQIKDIEKLILKFADLFNVVTKTRIVEPTRPKFYDEILKAINSGKLLSIEYLSRSSDMVSKRIIKPERVSIKNGYYYLLAVDQKVSADRVFRIDQISSVMSIEPNESQQLYENMDVKEFLFQLKITKQLITEKYREIFIEVNPKEDYFLVKGRSSNLQWLHRWVLSNASAVEVLEPIALRSAIAARAKSALDLYQP